jgi:hypothetical protein
MEYTAIDGQGMLVEAGQGVDAERFTEAARTALAAAQGTVDEDLAIDWPDGRGER